MTNLLPYPFCGSDNLEEDWNSVTVIYGKEYQEGDITCLNCEARVGLNIADLLPEAHATTELYKKWNTRYADSQALLQFTQLAKQDIENGDVSSVQSLRDKLAQRRNKLED